VQLYRYFVSQSSEFCRHNPLCSFSASVYCCKLVWTQSGNFWIHPRTCKEELCARFEVFTAVKIQVKFFLGRDAVTPCSVVVGRQSFGGPCASWYLTTTQHDVKTEKNLTLSKSPSVIRLVNSRMGWECDWGRGMRKLYSIFVGESTWETSTSMTEKEIGGLYEDGC
jgi:hypothetical protein